MALPREGDGIAGWELGLATRKRERLLAIGYDGAGGNEIRRELLTLSDPTAAPTRVKSQLEAAHSDFQALLDRVPAETLARPSRNPGWTNGELMAHMLLGFMIVRSLIPMVRFWGRLPRGSSRPFAWLLNLGTIPFNWFNAIGARLQGKVFTIARLRTRLDSTHKALVRASERITDSEWQRGMHMPSKWDPNFDDFMSLEQIFHYPVAHFHAHLEQLALPAVSSQ